MKQGKFSIMLFLLLLLFSNIVIAQHRPKQPIADSIYTVVDQQPEFLGGMAAMYTWLGKHTQNVDSTEGNLSSVSTSISFIVAKNGSLSDFQPGKIVVSANTKKGVKQANQIVQNMIDALKVMPYWKPGKRKGKPVRSTYYLPIRLELD